MPADDSEAAAPEVLAEGIAEATNQPLSEPLVSVIVPTYDRPEWLRVTLDSVVGQTYRNIEIIVADDGPNPATAEVVKSYNDPRIRYERHDGGIDMLQNSALAYSKATGTLVAGVHDDDVWHPQFLEKCVAPFIESPDLDLVFCDVWVIDNAGDVLTEESDQGSERYGRASLQPGRHQPWLDLAFEGTPPMIIGIVARNGVADWLNFPTEATYTFDRWYAYVLARRGGAAWYVDERLVYSRDSGENSTALLPLRWAVAGGWCHERFLEDDALAPARPLLKKKAAEYRTIEALVQLRAGETKAARRAAWRAVRPRPSVRSLGALGASLVPRRFLPERFKASSPS